MNSPRQTSLATPLSAQQHLEAIRAAPRSPAQKEAFACIVAMEHSLSRAGTDPIACIDAIERYCQAAILARESDLALHCLQDILHRPSVPDFCRAALFRETSRVVELMGYPDLAQQYRIAADGSFKTSRGAISDQLLIQNPELLRKHLEMLVARAKGETGDQLAAWNRAAEFLQDFELPKSRTTVAFHLAIGRFYLGARAPAKTVESVSPFSPDELAALGFSDAEIHERYLLEGRAHLLLKQPRAALAAYKMVSEDAPVATKEYWASLCGTAEALEFHRAQEPDGKTPWLVVERSLASRVFTELPTGSTPETAALCYEARLRALVLNVGKPNEAERLCLDTVESALSLIRPTPSHHQELQKVVALAAATVLSPANLRQCFIERLLPRETTVEDARLTMLVAYELSCRERHAEAEALLTPLLPSIHSADSAISRIEFYRDYVAILERQRKFAATIPLYERLLTEERMQADADDDSVIHELEVRLARAAFFVGDYQTFISKIRDSEYLDVMEDAPAVESPVGGYILPFYLFALRSDATMAHDRTELHRIFRHLIPDPTLRSLALPDLIKRISELVAQNNLAALVALWPHR